MRRYVDHPRVRSIRREHNLGHIAAHNEGIELARGEFVALMAADDFCLVGDAVARQVAVFDTHPDVGMVYSACTHVDKDSQPFLVQRPWGTDYVKAGLDEFRALLMGNYVPASGTMVRKSAHDRLGGYDPRLPHAGDWELWLRIAAFYSIAYISDSLFAYRIHSTNMSHSTIAARQANDEVMLTVEKAFAALPMSAPATIRGLRPAILRHALYVTTNSERALGRTRRSWAALVDVARRSPAELARPTFYGAGAKLAFQALVGFDRYVLLSRWRSGHTAVAS
jgi:glycosyltransferase involved in cell wall biosynthesis